MTSRSTRLPDIALLAAVGDLLYDLDQFHQGAYSSARDRLE